MHAHGARFGVALAAALGLSACGGGGSDPPPPGPPPPLAIANVAPLSAATAGGATLTITGVSFATTTTVTIGGVAASSITVLSSTTITCVVPSGTAGPADIVVSIPGGASTTESSGLTYVSGPAPAPTLVAVDATFGLTTGGNSVTLRGSGFQTGCAITIGGVAATSVVALTAGRATGVVPAAAAGAATVVLTNPDTQSATLSTAYRYGTASPLVVAVTPATASVAGGATLTITGGGFQGAGAAQPSVLIAGVASPSVTARTDGTLVCTVPALGVVGLQSIAITNPDGGTTTLLAGVAVVAPAPTIAGVFPGVGTVSGGTTVTVLGTDFYPGCVLRIGVNPATVSGVTPTTITATTPAGAPGPANVAVINQDGNWGSRNPGFTFVTPSPAISGVSPPSGSIAGGTTVTITGSNFTSGATATFGGVPAAVTGVAASQLVVTTGATTTLGLVTVRVTNDDGQSALQNNGYTYLGGAPTVAAITPADGATAGGTAITITGSNFYAGATVDVAGSPATVTAVTSTSIRAATPAGALGPRTVVVGNVDGQNVSVPGGFTYTGAPPTIGSVNPSGGAAASTAITLTGTNFAAGATVTQDGLNCTAVIVTSATQLTCTTPAVFNNVGAVPFVVTNIDGQSGALAGGYPVLGPTPTIGTVSPGSGTTAGGTTITITGTNYFPGATVSIGGAAATGVVLVTPTQLTCVAPAGTVGGASVLVGNRDGATSAGSTYTYVGGPSVTSVSPTAGTAAGGTALAITGTNFAGGATVTVGGAAATGVTVVSTTQITCTTPAGAVGPATVVVTNPGPPPVTAELAGGFLFTGGVPTLSSVSPTAGPLAGGTAATLTGTNFAAGATVTVGGAAATGIAVASPTQITCTTAAGPQGPANVVVTNADGQAATLASGFTYLGPAPTLSSVSPAAGPVAGGTTITLTGTNFAPGATVTVGGVAAAAVFTSGTVLVATTGAGAQGPATVVLTNVDGLGTSLVAGFTYQGAAPSVTAVSPASGTNGGGTTVTLTGTNFAAGATVSIGGVAAGGVVVLSPTACRAVTPAVAPQLGALDVRTTNVDGLAATLTGGFNALGLAPTLASVSPGSASNGGGATITLTGTNFATGATVTIGGTPAASVAVVSGTEARAVVPNVAPTLGPQAVRLTNTDGQSVTLASALNLLGPAPTLTGVAPASAANGGGATLTLTGTNFAAGATVTVGGAPAGSVVVAGSTTLTCAMPTLTPAIGPQAIVVTNADGQSAAGQSVNALGPTPTVSAVAPGAGPLAGGTAITITGSGFAPGAGVTVGGTAASVTALAGTMIVATTPAGSIGPAAVAVTNIDGQTGSLGGGFTYQGAAPSLTAVSPGLGPNTGGTTVTLTGSNFAAGATVTVGGVVASVSSIAAGQVVSTTPSVAPALGPQAVVVTNVDGQSAGGQTFNAQGAAPTLSAVNPTSGTSGGGTAITLTGSNFAAGATVTVGGAAATGVTLASATSLTCWTPAGSAGSANVVVTNVDAQNVALTAGYTYTSGPTIANITANNGPAAGGTTITIAGSNFASGATVTIGGAAATSVNLTGTTQIDCVTPAGVVGPAAVVVTNPGGASTTAPGGFTFVGASPTFSGIAPGSGTATGGTTVTITGGNFFAGATVTVGGVAASVSSVASGQIVAATGPGTPGPATVTVTNLDGNSVSSGAGAYTYVGTPPAVSGASPASGTTAGGTAVTITGSNFRAGATVTIGGVAAGVSSVAATTVVASTGAGTIGPGAVVVTNTDGTTGTLGAGFTYVGPAPTLSSVSPTAAANSGGAPLTLTGNNFATGATVRVGSVAATGVNVGGATQITCTMPDVRPALGPVDVTVTNVDGQAITLTGGVNAQGPAPALTSIGPALGPNGGGTFVTLAGTNFHLSASVRVGGVAASNVTVLSATQITAVTPALAPTRGAVNVEVQHADGQVATLTGGFNTQGPAPSVAGVSPASGGNGGGTAVTLTGANFETGATVTIGGVAAGSVFVAGPTQITCTTGSVAPVVGPQAVTVTNVDVTAGTLAAGFNALGGVPSISGLSPAVGTNAGGTTCTITGSNFAAGATVTFAGVAGTGVTVSSATQVVVTTPALPGLVGPADVVVGNLDGQSATSVGGFNALGATPTLTAVSPTTGTTGGGTRVTLTGTNFVAGATVDVGGTAATGVSVPSATAIECWTPAGTAGTVSVIVTNPDAQAVTLSSAYTFASGPLISSVAPGAGPRTGGTTITITGSNFVSGSTATVGGAAATSVTVTVPSQIVCTTPAGTAGAADVVVVNPGPVTTTAPNAFTYQWGPTDQTAAYTFDTASGIDCRRRWFVDFAGNAFLKDLQNRGLQSWGTPGDASAPPGPLPAVDEYARDWARAYVLTTLNIAYGRNADGTGVSTTSANITFVGLLPGSGAQGCATPAADWGQIGVAGCDPNGNGGPHPSASQAGCTSGTVGRALIDNVGGASCNLLAELDANSAYHACPSCTQPLGVFTGNIGNLWNQQLTGGQLATGDLPFLDGTTQTGVRYTQIHDFLKQYARRVAFVLAHEIGHSVGLVAAGTSGPCAVSSGLCSATQAHNNCCAANIMSATLNLGGTFTDTTLAFSGLPGGATQTGCATGGASSYALLTAWCGLTP